MYVYVYVHVFSVVKLGAARRTRAFGAALAAPTFGLKMGVSNYVGVPDVILYFHSHTFNVCMNFLLYTVAARTSGNQHFSTSGKYIHLILSKLLVYTAQPSVPPLN